MDLHPNDDKKYNLSSLNHWLINLNTAIFNKTINTPYFSQIPNKNCCPKNNVSAMTKRFFLLFS